MKKEVNILIIEDEEIAARKLKNLVKEIDPEINCLDITDSIESSVKWLDNTTIYPDLILMDIELADGQSFAIFTQTEIKCPVIFTTAYDEFALKAFKVNSIDYLLKPIKKEDLSSALNKWKSLTAKKEIHQDQNILIEKAIESILTQQSGDTYRKRFLVKQGQKLVPVTAEEIAYFYTEDKVIFIRTKNDTRFMIDFNLDELEVVLNPKNFFRANRQFILSSNCITEIHTWFNGKLKVSVTPKQSEEVIISRDKAADFKIWIGE